MNPWKLLFFSPLVSFHHFIVPSDPRNDKRALPSTNNFMRLLTTFPSVQNRLAFLLYVKRLVLRRDKPQSVVRSHFLAPQPSHTSSHNQNHKKLTGAILVGMWGVCRASACVRSRISIVPLLSVSSLSYISRILEQSFLAKTLLTCYFFCFSGVRSMWRAECVAMAASFDTEPWRIKFQPWQVEVEKIPEWGADAWKPWKGWRSSHAPGCSWYR